MSPVTRTSRRSRRAASPSAPSSAIARTHSAFSRGARVISTPYQSKADRGERRSRSLTHAETTLGQADGQLGPYPTEALLHPKTPEVVTSLNAQLPQSLRRMSESRAFI